MDAFASSSAPNTPATDPDAPDSVTAEASEGKSHGCKRFVLKEGNREVQSSLFTRVSFFFLPKSTGVKTVSLTLAVSGRKVRSRFSLEAGGM